MNLKRISSVATPVMAIVATITLLLGLLGSFYVLGNLLGSIDARLESQAASLKEVKADLKAGLKRIEDKVDGVGGRLDAFKAEMKADLKRLEDRFEVLETARRIEGFEGQ